MTTETIFLVDAVFNAAKMINDDFCVASKDNKGDLVTSLDFEIERFIIDRINDKYPTFDIISEEFNPQNKLTDNCFIIDPLDGTINFAHGVPLWGIQVACVKQGYTIASVIYLPKLGELYFANSHGAFVIDNPTNPVEEIMNAKPISVNQTPHNKAIYLVEGGYKFDALARLDKSTSRHFRYICSTAVNSAWTARGRFGGTILRKDSLWDYMPGQYLVKQAGGMIINKKGAHICANSRELARVLLRDGKE
ncbi:MAG: hypothetical protein FWE16_01265 [Firmicutes bacterium]|nr:hypothetical protein [Bacillota bacterium]